MTAALMFIAGLWLGLGLGIASVVSEDPDNKWPWLVAIALGWPFIVVYKLIQRWW